MIQQVILCREARTLPHSEMTKNLISHQKV